MQLFYFEKQTDKDPVGVIILEGCTVELAEEEIDKFAFKITFHGEGRRVYTMGTDDSVSFQVLTKQGTVSSFFFFGPPKEDIFSGHLLCPIFQSTLHITITSI